jgi:hypothetical protein
MSAIGDDPWVTDENRQARLNSPILCGFREYFAIRRVADLFLEDFLFPLFHFHRYLCQAGKNRHF